MNGQKGNAIAVVDHSGSLSEVENIGTLATARSLNATGAAVTGSGIALDLSANTSGVHLLQDSPSGATLTPTINGQILTGSGGDRLEILAGRVSGNINLGAGANSLTIDNSAVVKGNLDAPGGTLALAVKTGTLQINDASQLKMTSLSLGAASTLVFTADPVAGQATRMQVNGAATIATGAKIGVRLAEGSYTETGGGDAMDLAVGSRTSSRLSAFAGVAMGALYGADRSWGPEATLGYRAVASENLGVTTARYAGGNPFDLRSENISGAGASVHLSLRGENGSGGFAVEAGAEARDSLNIYDLRLTGHVQF